MRPIQFQCKECVPKLCLCVFAFVSMVYAYRDIFMLPLDAINVAAVMNSTAIVRDMILWNAPKIENTDVMVSVIS